MTAKSSALTGAAIAESAPMERTLRNREAGNARHKSLWRQELAAMLRAQLTNLELHGPWFYIPERGAARRLDEVTGLCARSSPCAAPTAGSALATPVSLGTANASSK